MQKKAKYETSPERLGAIRETLEAIFEERGGHAGDSFDDEESLRPLAQRLRVPYLVVLTTRLGFGGLSEADVEDYNAWRAMLGKAGKEAR
jgi:hypothetical protein